jgi:fumarate reductase (CoM/CoB) subunit A
MRTTVEAQHTMNDVIETDVLIVGGGGAACRAAIAAHDAGADVLVTLKGTLGHSGCMRYVGTNAAVGPWGDDDYIPESAMRDLVAHGGFLGNQELDKILTDESADRICAPQP